MPAAFLSVLASIGFVGFIEFVGFIKFVGFIRFNTTNTGNREILVANSDATQDSRS